jgi:hypothetical protein
MKASMTRRVSHVVRIAVTHVSGHDLVVRPFGDPEAIPEDGSTHARATLQPRWPSPVCCDRCQAMQWPSPSCARCAQHDGHR